MNVNENKPFNQKFVPEKERKQNPTAAALSCMNSHKSLLYVDKVSATSSGPSQQH